MDLFTWFRPENHDRPGMSEADFVKAMEVEGFPKPVSQAVYRYFSAFWSNRRDRSVHPDDSLYGSYRVAGGDLEEAVSELSRECGGVEPTTELVGHLPLETVRDFISMIVFLMSQRDDVKPP
jgi:hypothetical protein